MKLALAALLLLVSSACTARGSRPDDARGPGLIGALSTVSDVEAGLPVLVFVYTDG